VSAHRTSCILFVLSLSQIEHLPEAASPRLSLQLSSPVEEANISSLVDASDSSKGVASFRGVETNQATLTCSVFDEDIPLGSSEPCDVAPLCKFDAMDAREEYETLLDIAVKAPELPADEPQPADDLPICTVTLKFIYRPSTKDRREELYELLNQRSQRKTAAVEKLRQTAVAASRQQMMSASGTSSDGGQVVTKSATTQKAAVRAGFLNSKPKKEPSKLYQIYNKYLGPQSLIRAILPIAQNYVIFGSFVAFMHFKGQLLALPAPV
jgi:hypothetical protein